MRFAPTRILSSVENSEDEELMSSYARQGELSAPKPKLLRLAASSLQVKQCCELDSYRVTRHRQEGQPLMYNSRGLALHRLDAHLGGRRRNRYIRRRCRLPLAQSDNNRTSQDRRIPLASCISDCIPYFAYSQSCHPMYSLCKCGEKKDHDKGDDEQ